jgi:hypothetical protein
MTTRARTWRGCLIRAASSDGPAATRGRSGRTPTEPRQPASTLKRSTPGCANTVERSAPPGLQHPVDYVPDAGSPRHLRRHSATTCCRRSSSTIVSRSGRDARGRVGAGSRAPAGDARPARPRSARRAKWQASPAAADQAIEQRRARSADHRPRRVGRGSPARRRVQPVGAEPPQPGLHPAAALLGPRGIGSRPPTTRTHVRTIA